MNRILYVARKVKGLTEAQLAKVLDVEETDYMQLEHSMVDINAKQALKLAKIFEVDVELFLLEEDGNVRLIKKSMDEVSGYLNKYDFSKMPPEMYTRLISLSNNNLSLMADLNQALFKVYELEKDNQALRKLVKTLLEDVKVSTNY